jgi:hypothetical protein
MASVKFYNLTCLSFFEVSFCVDFDIIQRINIDTILVFDDILPFLFSTEKCENENDGVFF